ncbi:MAG: GNAT family N-acetyltransferase [Rubellimicrobium sp.]|nr:GNAT family N-acetyltransferase [Rubellimicrobium sp.]
MPSNDRIEAALATTWPPAALRRIGPVTLRDGAGGGARVGAATVDGAFTAADLSGAEQAMRADGLHPIFRIRPGEDDLDQALAARGYLVRDAVVCFIAALPDLATARPPPVTTFEVTWPPLAVQAEIWAASGTGPARLAVMARVQGPKATILGRIGDRPAGAAFVACDGDIAMLHAIAVLPDGRRQGLGRHMLTAAAFWAQRSGAGMLALLVTQENAAANALYQAAGMTTGPAYHYRIAPA